MYYKVRKGEVEKAIKEKGWQYNKIGNDELKLTYCPYCNTNHDYNNRGTFVINTRTGQHKCFRAKCTHPHGNFVTLATDFNIKLNWAEQGIKSKENIITDEGNGKSKMFQITPEMLEHNERTIAYFSSRGISKEICCDEFLCFDNIVDNESIVIPFLSSVYGDAPYVKYRHTDPNAESKETSEHGGNPIFFGLHRIQQGKYKRLVITEGQIDCMSVAQAAMEMGVDIESDITSVPNGAKGFKHCRNDNSINFLKEYDEIVVFGDHENGAITMVQEFVNLLSDAKTVKILTIPNDFYYGCKDANEILTTYGAEYLIKAIQAACEYEVQGIFVDNVPQDNRRLLFKTNIKELDATIGGGFYSGSVNIITGHSGEGKSSLSNQFVVEAIDQGIKTIVYSGETSPFEVQKGIHKILGGKYVTTKHTSWGVPEGYVDKQYTDYMQLFYKGHLAIIDTVPIHRETKPRVAIDMLISKIREGINRYGCECVIIDNLMTAVAEDRDIYANQSILMRLLTDLANDYKVCVLLLAHPRKELNGTSDNNIIKLSDISGTGNLANLSTIVLSYQRYHVSKKKKDEIDKDKCVEVKGELRPCSGFIRVLKNRINGNLSNRSGDECCVFFHKITGRIMEKQDFKNYAENHIMKNYRWVTDFESKLLK